MIGCGLAGAERIVAIDLSEARIQEAERHGATDTRIADEDTLDDVNDAFDAMERQEGIRTVLTFDA